jgi:hypothetical protein
MIDTTNIALWQGLTAPEQAQLRWGLMRELSWIDWDQQPAWWWDKTHGELLEVKWACGRAEREMA